jgi:diguanylate cyclase (GGDEF)-like protein/PAS domain S-box-containing protein
LPSGDIVAIYNDVTENAIMNERLAESEKKYASYIENAPDGVFVADKNAYFIEVNHAASLITGYSKEELLQMSIRDIIAEESLEDAMIHFKTLSEKGPIYGEYQYIHKNGSRRWWTVDAIKLSDNSFLGFSKDITDKIKAEEELVYLSYHDYLTGIYNRRFLELEKIRLDAQIPLSIIIGDINGLKLINDAFGHAEGDKLIAQTAKILQNACRKGDIVARTGGDEFCILLPKTDTNEALEVLKEIQVAFESHNSTIANEVYHINISLGFGTKGRLDQDFQEVVKTAEDYMYQRKLLERKSSHSAIISSIKATMIEKNHVTEQHAERLVALCEMLGRATNLPQGELDKLVLLAMLHDIGKVGIDDSILNKPGKLSEEEWVEMRKHPMIGYRIAKSSPDLIVIADYILSHHEWWDGSGYPQGLTGHEIPLLARILAVVDAYDAMTQDRPYRSALSKEVAMQEIKKNAGTQFDPEIAQLFVCLMDEQKGNN